MGQRDADVIVVGAGNAALCAALAARERGARVTVLERAPEEESGGNSRYTAGAVRLVFGGVDDLVELMPDLTEDERRNVEFGAYTREQYFDDLGRLTQWRSDPDLAETLIDGSFETLRWMRGYRVRFSPSYGRQAFKVDGRYRFWGGLAVEVWGGGPGLVQALTEAARDHDIPILYGTRATDLVEEDEGVRGVVARRGRERLRLGAGAVVLACGGFESNAEWRTRYLGPGWDLAKVRGTRYNTGDGIRMALDAGAMPYGNWSGCHAVGWDRNAPPFGDLAVGDNFQKHSYPLGIMVNADGRRFVDEGADFRNYTYARYGKVILDQPDQFAWQVFDAKVLPLLRDEYRIREVTKVAAGTLEELAGKLEGVDGTAFLDTVHEYNEAVRTDVPFNPAVKGRSRHAGARNREVELGEPSRRTSLRGLPDHLRDHVHLRGPPDRRGVPGARHRGRADPGASTRRGSSSAASSTSTIRGGTGLVSGAVFGRRAGAAAGRHATA